MKNRDTTTGWNTSKRFSFITIISVQTSFLNEFPICDPMLQLTGIPGGPWGPPSPFWPSSPDGPLGPGSPFAPANIKLVNLSLMPLN